MAEDVKASLEEYFRALETWSTTTFVHGTQRAQRSFIPDMSSWGAKGFSNTNKGEATLRGCVTEKLFLGGCFYAPMHPVDGCVVDS
eukprot:scaffold4675_cov101-Cylindrotheca_fusiformis.AAC.4